MGIEIERKFRVLGEGWRSEVARSLRMAQGYINDAAAMQDGRQRASVRVRIAGHQAYLNLKSRELGTTRQEFDYEIPLADGEALLALCVGGRIDKLRHYVERDGFTFEIDEFFGDNAGLIVAELELESAAQAYPRPDWLGSEVTEERRYYNLALAERPYSHWSDEEKA